MSGVQAPKDGRRRNAVTATGRAAANAAAQGGLPPIGVVLFLCCLTVATSRPAADNPAAPRAPVRALPPAAGGGNLFVDPSGGDAVRQADTATAEAAIASFQQLTEALRPFHKAKKFTGTIRVGRLPPPRASIADAGSAPEIRVPVTRFIKRCTESPSKLCEGEGHPFWLAGTNIYFLAMDDGKVDDQQSEWILQKSAAEGVSVIRMWAFANGDWYPDTFQPRLREYSEQAFRKLDNVVCKGGQLGIRFILPFVNFWHDYNGMDWYVEQVLGAGHALEEFYTDPAVKQAYKDYIEFLLNRVNTCSGIAYKDDPAVMAWQLANEPQTTWDYEKSRGMRPGSLVYEWAREMAAFIKSIDSNHLVALGDEGWEADAYARGPHLEWMNSGGKGIDFSRNTCEIPEVDFATIHFYPEPQAQGIPAWNVTFARDYIFAERAAVALGCGKAIVLEEHGVREGASYLASRNEYLDTVHDWITDLNFAGALVWQHVPGAAAGLADYYTFSYEQDGSAAMTRLYTRYLERRRSA